MVVDDSAVIRQFMRSVLDNEPDITVVATAGDAFSARDKFLELRPDVVTLDINMPKVGGLVFLEKLMSNHPTPVVMFSSYTREGAQETLQALSLGAVDFIAKPARALSERLPSLSDEIISKVRTAARAKVAPAKKFDLNRLKTPQLLEVDEFLGPARSAAAPVVDFLVLLGASTGGTAALEQVLSSLPEESPPIAVVQHMPESFTTAFAQRLDGLCRIKVAEARDRQILRPGMALIAPGGRHMLLEQCGQGVWARVKDGPRVNRHKPSVDVLFRSGVNTAGANCLAVLMTGMGKDGARGMKDLHQAGAMTIAQDEATSIVYGMPKAAVDIGAARCVMPLEKIGPCLYNTWLNSSPGRPK